MGTSPLRSIGLGVGVALALVGCGHAPLSGLQPSSTQSARAATARALFPDQAGTVWSYATVAHPTDDPDVDEPGTSTVQVDSVATRGETTVLNLRMIDSYLGQYRFATLEMSASGVRLKGVEYWGVAADQVDDLAIDFLELPFQQGHRWDDGEWIGKIKARETVRVPAGQFDAWAVEVIGTHDHAYTAVGTYWIAPGTGIVKSDLNIPGWNVESALTSARVARRS